MWTKVKRASWIGSILAVIVSAVTLVSTAMGRIWWQAIADDKLNTLWTERTTKLSEIQEIKECISDMKTDIAVVKNDTAWIKEFLKTGK